MSQTPHAQVGKPRHRGSDVLEATRVWAPGAGLTLRLFLPACPGTGLRKVMVRAHRQAWCWQDEWYGLSMENIRELEKEAQLMLSRKMAQFSEDDEEAAELAKGEAGQAQAPREPPQASSGEPLAGRGLKKQWSTSSKSSRSSKRGGECATLAPWGPCPPLAHPSDSPQPRPRQLRATARHFQLQGQALAFTRRGPRLQGVRPALPLLREAVAALRNRGLSCEARGPLGTAGLPQARPVCPCANARVPHLPRPPCVPVSWATGGFKQCTQACVAASETSHRRVLTRTRLHWARWAGSRLTRRPFSNGTGNDGTCGQLVPLGSIQGARRLTRRTV